MEAEIDLGFHRVSVDDPHDPGSVLVHQTPFTYAPGANDSLDDVVVGVAPDVDPGPDGQRPSTGRWLIGMPFVSTSRSSSVGTSSCGGTVSIISVLVNQADGL